MSRIAKKPIKIGDKTKVTLEPVTEGYLVKVIGPLGENSRVFKKDIKIEIDEEGIKLTPTSADSLKQKALWGTYASHIKNLIEGVTTGFKKNLQIEGIGYKTQVAGNKMTWSLGFSHTVDVEIPKGLKVTVEKSIVSITGIDKEVVGQFAAQMVAMKPPEPYKGKGIRYEGQVIAMKEGKKSIA